MQTYFATCRHMHDTFLLLLLVANFRESSAAAGDFRSEIICPFKPTPLIPPTKDTVLIQYRCQSSSNNSLLHKERPLPCENVTRLIVNFTECPSLPVGLFVECGRLESLTIVSEDRETKNVPAKTFQGLDTIREFRAEGFEYVRNVSSDALLPIASSIETLILVRLGFNVLYFKDLGTALDGLDGAPRLDTVVLHQVRGSTLADRGVNVEQLFGGLKHSPVRRLIFSDNYAEVPDGSFLSVVIPNATQVCWAGNHNVLGTLLVLDALALMPRLADARFLAFPDYVLSPEEDKRERDDHDRTYSNPLYLLELMKRMSPALRESILSHLNLSLVDCYMRVMFAFSPEIRSLTLHGLRFLKSNIDDHRICFDEENKVEIIDVSGCDMPFKFPVLTGFPHLRRLDMNRTGITSFSNEFLAHFPRLEIISFGRLSIGDFFQSLDSNKTSESFFGSCPTLKEIHIGECQLTTLPGQLFQLLPSLQVVNVSGNFLRAFDVRFNSTVNLSSLLLTNNQISTLPLTLTDHLDRTAAQVSASVITVDLSGNLLSCQCNATGFVSWLQKSAGSRHFKLPNFQSILCTHPSGTIVRVVDVDLVDLSDRCKALGEFVNGSDCPCDVDLRRRLSAIWKSLDGIVCRNADNQFVTMSVQPLPACRHNAFLTATFIAPVTIGSALALTLVVAAVVGYRYRKTERVRQVVECLDMHRVVRVAIEYFHQRQTDAAERSGHRVFSFDVFLFAHDDDWPTLTHRFRAALLPERSFVSAENFLAGCSRLETMLESFRLCRWMIVVLTRTSVGDFGFCSLVSRFLLDRPTALVPVVWEDLTRSADEELQLDENLGISELLRTGEPLRWPGDDASDDDVEAFWAAVLDRTSTTSDQRNLITL